MIIERILFNYCTKNNILIADLKREGEEEGRSFDFNQLKASQLKDILREYKNEVQRNDFSISQNKDGLIATLKSIIEQSKKIKSLSSKSSSSLTSIPSPSSVLTKKSSKPSHSSSIPLSIASNTSSNVSSTSSLSRSIPTTPSTSPHPHPNIQYQNKVGLNPSIEINKNIVLLKEKENEKEKRKFNGTHGLKKDENEDFDFQRDGKKKKNYIKSGLSQDSLTQVEKVSNLHPSSSSSSHGISQPATLYQKLMLNLQNRSVVADLKFSLFKEEDIIEAINSTYKTSDSLLDFDSLMFAILAKSEVVKSIYLFFFFFFQLVFIYIFLLVCSSTSSF